jgi:ribonuclease HII
MTMASADVAEEFPEITREQRSQLFELLRKEEAADLRVLRAREDLKDHKESAELAHQELKDYLKKLRGDKRPMPLFDGHEKPEESKATKPVKDESWREVRLSSIFPPAIAEKLKKAKLETIGQMADFSNSGTPFTGIKGIGRETADKIEKRMVEYWEKNPVDE